MFNFKSIDCNIVCIIILNLLTISIYCDEQHSGEGQANTQEQSSSGWQESKQQQPNTQQLADPEYIRREVKDVLRKIDSDKDGYASFEEIKNYLAELHEKNTDYNVNKQWVVYSPQIHEVFSWEGYEPEKKEVLTWDHYFNQTYPDLIGIDIGIPLVREQDTASILNPPTDKSKKETKVVDDNDGDDLHLRTLKLMVRRADARWKLADENGDTLLTKQEFKLLLHPDEGNEELQNLFIREATEDMDLDKDDKISLDEFMKHLQVLANDQEKNDQNWLATQQENFGRFLDKDKDGVLDKSEIKDWLIPSKTKRSETEAKRLMDIGDSNEDHKLSSAEVLEHYEQYLVLLPADYWRNSNDLGEISEDSLMGDQGTRDEL